MFGTSKWSEKIPWLKNLRFGTGGVVALVALTALLLSSLSIYTAQAQGEDLAPFSITTDAGVVTSESLQGNLVYVDFWASWCAPCRESFPWMNEMQAKYADQGLKIFAVSLDQKRRDSDAFLAEVPADFTIGFDPEGKLAEHFKVIGMPMAFVIDQKGRLVDKHTGFINSKRPAYEASLVEHL